MDPFISGTHSANRLDLAALIKLDYRSIGTYDQRYQIDGCYYEKANI